MGRVLQLAALGLIAVLIVCGDVYLIGGISSQPVAAWTGLVLLNLLSWAFWAWVVTGVAGDA